VRVVPVLIDRVLAAAFESGDFEPLAGLYAAEHPWRRRGD
jgi:hypothetical protein